MSSAVEWVDPSHLTTVDQLSLGWQTNRAALARLWKALRADGRRLEGFTVIEACASGQGAHAHVLLHGEVPGRRKLRELTSAAGLAMPHMVTMDRAVDNASYFCKVAAWTQQGLLTHIELNGGRLFHASRGFWLDTGTGELMRCAAAESHARGYVSLESSSARAA